MDRGIDIVMFSGDRIAFGRFELSRALFHRHALLYYVIITGVLSQLELFQPFETMTGGQRLTSVIISILSALVGVHASVLAVELFQKPGTRPVVHGTWVILVASGLSTLVTEWYVRIHLGDGIPGLLHFLIIWTCFFIIMQILSHYVMVRMIRRILRAMRRVGDVPAGDRSSADETILIKGQSLKPGEIRRITAERNYIRIVMVDRQHFLPGPFGPVIEGLPRGLGLQVSRSDWVAAAAVSGLRKTGRNLTLDLADGSAVRVAESRGSAVTEWVATLN